MSIPKGYKLVPLHMTEEMFMAWRGVRSGYRDKYIKMLGAAPTPPQPIYDEAKERELFEAYCVKVGLPIDVIPSGEYLIPATRFMSQGWHARAKSVEVGDE